LLPFQANDVAASSDKIYQGKPWLEQGAIRLTDQGGGDQVAGGNCANLLFTKFVPLYRMNG